MASKTSADHEVGAIIQDLVARHYPELAEAEVRKNPVDMRRKGVADATIIIDGPAWRSATERQNVALVDHELRHLKVVRHRKTGEILVDDAGRPVLKLELHDWQLGGFAVIAARYGEDAPEVRAAHALRDDFGRLLFDRPCSLATLGGHPDPVDAAIGAA